MEKLMLGAGITDQMTFGCKNKIGECYSLVKKGHEECGDSAFVYMDEKKFILAVFDGVSGESGAAGASSEAAVAALEVLKGHDKGSEKIIQKAISAANSAIGHGYTTAAIAFIAKDGSVIVAGVGDSPIYGITKNGKALLELPLGRQVGDNNSIFKFFYFRNLVTSVLGPSGVDIHIHTREGKLKTGEMLIVATDCLNDNLYIKIKEGYLTDSTGREDLEKLIKNAKKPESIVKKLAKEIEKRIKGGNIEKKHSMLVPKQDDLAIIVFKKA